MNRILSHGMACFAIFLSTGVWVNAANICVGPTVTGDGSGSNWNNLKAWSAVPARGDTWYLMDGTYSGKTLNTAASGTTVITIKKATAYDHATETGWSSTMGDGQAAFTGGIKFNSSYWVFDGVTGGGPTNNWTNNFGFKVTETADGGTILWIGNGTTVNNIKIRHIDMQGKGSASGLGGSYSNDGIAISGDSDITLSYAWMHGIGRCPVFFIGGGPATFEYIYVQSYFAGSDVHGEIMSASQGVMNDVTWRYCLFTDIQSTGGLMWDNSNGAGKCEVYGNVFYKPAGAIWAKANGIIGGWTGGYMYNYRVFNNTFINCDQLTLTNFPRAGVYGGCEASNNLWYNCQAPAFSHFPIHGYNHFIASGGANGEATGTSASSGDPFVNYSGLDFALKANTTPGVNLGAPYNVDMFGRTRSTWTRGAVEFAAPGANQSPSVSTISHNSTDVNPIAPGLQIFVGMVVQYSGSGSGINGNPPTWQWIYTINGGADVVYLSGTGSVAPATFSYANATAGSTYVWKLRVNDGVATAESQLPVQVTAPPIVGEGLSFEAESGIISTPIISASGFISQSSTTDLASSGRAVYSFTVANAGNYVIEAMVDAPSFTANSYYLNIDAEPQDNSMAWDILPPTVGIEKRFVSRRGNGTADANEITPQVFYLTQGAHQLIIRGREANTQLDRFSILKLPSQPQNLRRVSGL